MEPGLPESKRPRLSTGSWSAGPSHHGVSLPHPAPPPPAHHPPPPGPYQQPSHPFSRPPEQPPHPASHFDDRRHHEPEPYPPMQDHRQPPPSPAHPPYSAYPPREPVVKRDPGEDTLPQLRRPHSTGNADASPATPHGPPPPLPPHSASHSHQDEYRRHISFDNGPQMYRHPSYPPPTPVQHAQPYEQPSYGPPPPPGGEALYNITYTTATKRKAQRASQACDLCRQLKAKCDEMKPCKSCKEKKMPCKYRETVPKPSDKITADILEGINLIRSQITSEFKTIDQRISRLEGAVKQVNPAIDLKPDPEHEEFKSFAHSPSPMHVGEDDESSPDDEARTMEMAQDAPLSSSEARAALQEMVHEDEEEDVPGPPVPPGEPALRIGHTTLAGLLLTWPSIRDMVHHLLEKEKIKYPGEFPIRQEQQRGLLRVYGRGEGPDRDAYTDQEAVDIRDDVSDMASASPGPSGPPDHWGPIGDPMVDLKMPPDYSEKRVWDYVQSFQENILNMHPILIPKELYAMVKIFLEMNPASSSKQSKSTTATIAKFAIQSTPTSQPQNESGSKRKRSPGAEGADSPLPIPKLARPQRSIQNALVLLVLALGKICLHKEKLPDVIPDSTPPQGSPIVRNGHPASPLQGSPPSYGAHSHSSGLPSPKEFDRTIPSRRSSFQGTFAALPKMPHTTRRNLDEIPGLDYFALATDIIGNQVGGTTLKHVYVNILAGLFHGQLGRPMESWAYIALASRTLQIILRPSLDRLRKLNSPELGGITHKKDNQMTFAFWTCVQLESDILAELPLPQTGILAYDQEMPYPNLHLAASYGIEEQILESYSAQLYLRKRLNQIHRMMYDPSAPQRHFPSPDDDFETIEAIQQSLTNMHWVPNRFNFNEKDPPASDILSARLRAKYWGAQVIVYRPFIKQILNFSYSLRHSTVNQHIPISGGFRTEIPVPVIDTDAKSPEDVPPQVIEYARKGITALIESTRAFHGLEERRYIVTNIFGTAHAQWGNILTLSAAARDPVLGKYVDEYTLKELFRRTISFFRIISHPSSSLHVDMRILEGLADQLWPARGHQDMDTVAQASFCSTNSAGQVHTPTGGILHGSHRPYPQSDSQMGTPTPMHIG